MFDWVFGVVLVAMAIAAAAMCSSQRLGTFLGATTTFAVAFAASIYLAYHPYSF